ncbi:MAG: hypothetical protein A2V78_09455 [Betaproteobacteria bacterium RBG_16_64_18]|nr:MAG: hypothetical protein A2V78_09455 [Betaproteobacteria bacterium RBG_16_64_18]
MDKPKLSDREAAIIEAARRELAGLAQRKTQPEATPASASGSPIESPAPANSARPDPAERIAALMRAEQEQSSRRKKRLRQYGIVIPALILIAAVLWVMAAIFRYARI